MPTATADAMDIDLKLHGGKIKLESRPSSRESTASSKSAYLAQGPSRPSSAVPRLRLYDSKGGGGRADFDEASAPPERRPYSADNIPFGGDIKGKSSRDDPAGSLHSIDEIDKDLPSTDLLKSLISEPIPSWRNGYNYSAQEDMRADSHDETLPQSNTSDEDSSSGDTCSESAAPVDIKLTLVPGLTTKPPIPKKSQKEINHLGVSKAEDFKRSARSKNQNTPRCCDSDSSDNSSPRKARSINHKESKDLILPERLVDPVQYRNWLDSKEEEKNSLIAESHTNFLFDQLRKQQSDFENAETNNANQLMFEKFFASQPVETSDKTITIIEPTPKPKQTNLKCRNEQKHKSNSVKFAPKVTKVEQIKPKFVAKTMKSDNDYVDRSQNGEEVDTWVSKTNRSDAASTSGSEWVVEGDNRTDMKKLEEVLDDIVPEQEGDNCSDNLETSDAYDEIASILEVLEAESRKSKSSIRNIKNIVNSELNATINSIPDSHLQSNAEKVIKDSTDRASSRCSNLSGDVKSSKSSNFNEILCFLDEVDRSSSRSVSNAKEKIIQTNQMIEGAMRLDTIPRLENLLNHTPVELSNQVIDLHLRLKEKSSAIKLLQDELSALREYVMKTNKQMDTIVKEKLRSQKEESDGVVRRHQKFIDQLIADKTSLNQQCESLVHEMKLLEDKFNSNMKAVEHRHNVELQKVKEMHVAGEKIRRERWIDSKTQKIKEMTVKSIEPEINSMTIRHERELADLRALQKKEIEDIDMKNARKMQQHLENLRQQMTEEREKALAHEREVMRLRYESLVESEEKGYQEQRKRLLQEHASRMDECESKELSVIAEKERAIKHVQNECDDKIHVLTRRHENEIKLFKDTAQLEMESWKTNLKKQQELVLATKEHAIRDQCKRERDKEIESVIERLEGEANENRTQMEAATENRIRRMRQKFEDEFRDLEATEKDAKKRYAGAKDELLTAKDELITLKATVKHTENQLADYKELYEKLSSEKCTMKEMLREEMRSEITGLEKEIERIKQDRDAELQQVCARVKVAVGRKDEMLAELSRDLAALKEKCKYLESMLEQQRKEYLIK